MSTEPKTNKERSRTFRKRQAEIGRKGRIYYLTRKEHRLLRSILEFIRDDPSDDKTELPYLRMTTISDAGRDTIRVEKYLIEKLKN